MGKYDTGYANERMPWLSIIGGAVLFVAVLYAWTWIGALAQVAFGG